MRGRWASAALGAGIARHRAGMEMQQQEQAFNAQQEQAQRQIEAQQRQIEALQQQQQHGQQSQHHQYASGGQEDITSKLQKLADLHQKGLLTDDEFSKMKMNLLSQL